MHTVGENKSYEYKVGYVTIAEHQIHQNMAWKKTLFYEHLCAQIFRENDSIWCMFSLQESNTY